jgi:23S rRNA (cytosine1962-C5)-methyltransferase
VPSRGGARADEPVLGLTRSLGRSLGRGHPWVWRDSLRGILPPPGQIVQIADERGSFVARGLAEAGPIGVRVMTTQIDEPIDRALFERRINAAAALRDRLLPPATSCYRLLHGEGDRLPGVVCDVYGPFAVLRLDGEGPAAWLETLVPSLIPALGRRGVRSLLLRRGRQQERRVTALSGVLPEGPIVVTERGMKLAVDLCRGQKTGLFLDHRDSRWHVRQLAVPGRALNLFGYTGGFSVAAGLGGAEHVDTVDAAPGALELAGQSWQLNGLGADRHATHLGDAFDFVEQAARAGRRWQLVVSDPPSFAPSASSRDAALRAYRRLHRACLGLLEPGGLYLAASCSSHVDRAAFIDTLLDAAPSDGLVLQLVGEWGAAADHPRLAAFPEGDYLKVLLLRRV